MRQQILSLTSILILLSSVSLLAQTPAVTEINFLVGGQSVESTSNGDVTVELTFSQSMDQTIDPAVKFGLGQSFSLNVPKAQGQGWISTTLWQGFFTVSNNNPESGDGEYLFKIYGAKNLGGTEMDTTYSHLAPLDKSLFICRSGELSLNTSALDFGTITAGTSKSLSVTVTNNSCSPLHVNGVSLPFPFSLTNSTSGFVIAGDSSHTLTIAYSPTTRSSSSGNMTIQSDDRKQGTHLVQLSGSSSGPQIQLTPASRLDFGKLDVGLSLTKTIFVSNPQAADQSLSDTLIVASITTNGSIYTVSPSTLKVAPGDTSTVEVTFAPSAHRSYGGFILSFNSNDLTQSLRTIVLNGDSSDESPPPPLTNLSVDWSGYGGFTNSINLPLCWENPDDPTGIAEIWWKFVRSAIPPQSATDTTSAGGRFVLPPDTTCANIPLFGRLSTGRWYCYVWLVDGSGNSGYANAVATSFVYDITPPGIPIITGRSIVGSRWFGSNDVFSLTLEIPSDAVRGAYDASEVRWKYKGTPGAATDFDGRFFISGLTEGRTTFNVPFASTDLCGDDSLYVWLADSSGNVSSDSVAFTRYRFDICPPEIVRIHENDRNIAIHSQAYRDTVVIADDVKVETAWVRYRFGGATAEQPPRPATRIAQSDSFVVEIPQAGVTRRGVEFMVVATDSLGNDGRGPTNLRDCTDDSHINIGPADDDEIWFPIRTRVETDFRIDADGRPVPLIVGEREANYQLFSIPYDLDTSAVMTVLQDDLGSYDKTMWRLFDYRTENPEGNRFIEGANARAFTPGRSYFIITRQENIVVDSGPGVSKRTVCPDTIRVYEGWNLIATPFNFPVNTESLHLVNADSEIVLWSYESGWNLVDAMDPWKGYAVFVTRPNDQSSATPMYLIAEPHAVPPRSGKLKTNWFDLGPGDWRIQISGNAGTVADRENWVGVDSRALAGYDRLELAEPPVVGDYLMVAIPHPEWELPARHFSTDIRPNESNEQAWEFEVKTNLSRQQVNLTFDFVGDLPADVEIHLIDEQLKLAQNLRAKPVFTFTSGSDGSVKKLKLVVGSHRFAAKQAGEIGLIPQEFELMQNFPNPFNPETSIRYNLAGATRVSFEIYDLLGRKVRTLLSNERQEAGYYSIAWNGKNEGGMAVASGVYIYRLVTSEKILTRKMILMK